MSQRYLVSYQGGTGGHFMGGMLSLFLNQKFNIAVDSRGSMHYFYNTPTPWYELAEDNIDQDFEQHPNHEVYITHCRSLKRFAESHNMKVIKITYKPEHYLLLRTIVTSKNQLPNLKSWYGRLPDPPFDDVDLDNIQQDPRVVNFLYDIIDRNVREFIHQQTHWDYEVPWADYWVPGSKLLDHCSAITGKVIPSSAQQLLADYQRINHENYNVCPWLSITNNSAIMQQ